MNMTFDVELRQLKALDTAMVNLGQSTNDVLTARSELLASVNWMAGRLESLTFNQEKFIDEHFEQSVLAAADAERDLVKQLTKFDADLRKVITARVALGGFSLTTES